MMRRVSFLIFLVCIFISFKNQNDHTKKGVKQSFCYVNTTSNTCPLSIETGVLFLSCGERVEESRRAGEPYRSLEYASCPKTDDTIFAIVRYLCKSRSDIPPSFLGLVSPDCFFESCDASLVLEDAEGIDSDKKSPPNQSLKGLYVIDIIKEELDELCHDVVSCADILASTAREVVVLAGVPFCPLYTGRRDSMLAFADRAILELPSPNADISENPCIFLLKGGFHLREIVTMFGVLIVLQSLVLRCKLFICHKTDSQPTHTRQNEDAGTNSLKRKQPDHTCFEQKLQLGGQGRLKRPKKHLNHLKQGTLKELKIRARLFNCVTLAAEDTDERNIFTYELRCRSCACYLSIELQESGQPFTLEDAEARSWVTIVKFRSSNLHNFFYNFRGSRWTVCTIQGQYFSFTLTERNLMRIPSYFVVTDINSNYFGYSYNDPEGNFVFGITLLVAAIHHPEAAEAVL